MTKHLRRSFDKAYTFKFDEVMTKHLRLVYDEVMTKHLRLVYEEVSTKCLR